MDHDGLVMFHRFVMAAFRKLGRVVEVARRDGLPDVDRLVRVRNELDLNSFEKTLKLIANIARPLHASVLNKVFVAPLRRVIGFCPLIVNVQ